MCPIIYETECNEIIPNNQTNLKNLKKLKTEFAQYNLIYNNIKPVKTKN
jgi:hypothetical protein